jgi:hypothetical protein
MRLISGSRVNFENEARISVLLRECQKIRAILKLSRPVDHLSYDPLQPEFEKRAIVAFEQPIGDVNAIIGVDADQMGVEGRVM